MFTVITRNILVPKNSIIRLGRWNVAKSIDDQHLQVDLANHDNCGPCALPSKKVEEFDSSMDVSMCALQSLSIDPKPLEVNKTKGL